MNFFKEISLFLTFLKDDFNLIILQTTNLFFSTFQKHDLQGMLLA